MRLEPVRLCCCCSRAWCCMWLEASYGLRTDTWLLVDMMAHGREGELRREVGNEQARRVTRGLESPCSA